MSRLEMRWESLRDKEVIDALHGDGPEDLMEVVYALGTQMLLLAKRAEDEEIARNLITESIQERKALKNLQNLLKTRAETVKKSCIRICCQRHVMSFRS